MPTITGQFLKDERKRGTFEGTPYDFTLLHVLEDVTVFKVRLPRDVHDHPFTRGDEVSVRVQLADNAKITTTEADYRAALASV